MAQQQRAALAAGACPLVGNASASICGSGSGREPCYLLAVGGAGGQPVAVWQWQQWQCVQYVALLLQHTSQF
jgi:hypothetical protein